MFSRALVQVPESAAYITCIAQITLKFINYTLLVNNSRFFSHALSALCFRIKMTIRSKIQTRRINSLIERLEEVKIGIREFVCLFTCET